MYSQHVVLHNVMEHAVIIIVIIIIIIIKKEKGKKKIKKKMNWLKINTGYF